MTRSLKFKENETKHQEPHLSKQTLWPSSSLPLHFAQVVKSLADPYSPTRRSARSMTVSGTVQ